MEYYVFNIEQFLLIIMEIVTYFVMVSALLNIRKVTAKWVLFVLGYACLYEVSKLIIPHYLSWIVCVLIGTPIISYLHKEKVSKVLMSWLITGVTASIIDVIVSYSILIIFELKSFEELIQNNYYIPGKFVIAICILIVSAFIYYSKMKPNSLYVKCPFHLFHPTIDKASHVF